MDPKVVMYVSYLVVSIGLTVWVATTLSRNGLVYVAFAMRSGAVVTDASQALETLSRKLGLVLLVLGALHFANVFVLGRYRRGRLRQNQPPAARPPLPPAGRLPMPPMPPARGGFPQQGTIPPPATA